MAFVNEYISEADKARIDFSKIKHPVHQDPIIPYKWTIDRDRDIALIPLGGGIGEFPYFFVMYWQGQAVNVYMRTSKTGNFTTSDLEVTWRIEHIWVPDNVPREEMLKTLKEALFTYGYMSTDYRDKVKAVHFEF